MKTERLFSSYLSAGLLTTSLGALAFTHLSVIAFALVGLTVGIATRNLRRCLAGFFTSLGVSLLMGVFIPMTTDRPSGFALDWDWPVFLAALLGALAGAALQLDDATLTVTAIVGAVVSLGALVAVALFLRLHTTIEYRMLERWEYATILLAVPIIGAGVWWPLDVMAKHLEFRLERRAAALRHALLKRS